MGHRNHKCSSSHNSEDVTSPMTMLANLMSAPYAKIEDTAHLNPDTSIDGRGPSTAIESDPLGNDSNDDNICGREECDRVFSMVLC